MPLPFTKKSAKNNKENPNPQEQMSQTSRSVTVHVGNAPPGPGYHSVFCNNRLYWIPPGYSFVSPGLMQRNGSNLPLTSPNNQSSSSPIDSHRITPQPPPPSSPSGAQRRPPTPPSQNPPHFPPPNNIQRQFDRADQFSHEGQLLGQQVIHSEQRDLEIGNLRRQLQDEKRRVEELTLELSIAREDHSSLRANLQLDDGVERGQMAKDFRAINRSIEDVSITISNWFCKQYELRGVDVMTTGNAVNPRGLYDLVPMLSNANSTLVRSSNGDFRPLEEFVDFTLRCQLVRRIHFQIFIPFHPGLENSGETRETLEKVYQEMRKYESQIVCGRWRSMLFNGLQSSLDKQWDRDYIEAQAAQFESEVINSLFEVIYDAKTTSPDFPHHPHTPQLHELFKQCLEWNNNAKSQMFSMDYTSILLPNKGTFDSARMQHLDTRDKLPRSTTVIAAITLGLQSEIAQGKGWANGPKPAPVGPECRILDKVTVITDDYFRSNR